MTAVALAGVLEAIAYAIRELPDGTQTALGALTQQTAPPQLTAAPPLPPPPSPPVAVVPIVVSTAATAAPSPAQASAPAKAADSAPPQAATLQADQSPASGETVATWLRTFQKIVADRGYKTQTLKNRSGAQKHIESLLGNLTLRAVKPFQITTALKTLSPHTAGRVLFELRDLFNEAIANGEADINPAAHVKPPAAPCLRKRLTLEVWQAMLARAKAGPQKWVPAMLLLALATGQRRADIAKMRFSDVVDGCLRIEQQKKARKKIGARVAIPLSLRLSATGMTLGDVIEHCGGIGKPGEFLLRQSNGRPIEMSSLTSRFHEHIVAVCGEDAYLQYEWPSLHEVRSLSARTYISEGMTPEVCQKLLGHKHTEMTALYLDDRGLTEAKWKLVAA